MWMVARFVIGLGLALGLQAAAGAAFAAGSDNCFSELVCAYRDEVIASYGLEPAEKLSAEGVTAVRVIVMVSSKFGEPATVFSRRPGALPHLEVVTGQTQYAARVILQDRPAPLAVWRKVQASAALIRGTATASVYSSFREELGPGSEVGESLCFDPKAVLVEVIEPSGVTRRARTICFADPVTAAAWSIGEDAVAISPGCGGLDKRVYNSPFARLNMCRWLRGDVRSAAQVRNMAGQPVFNAGPDEPESEDIGRWFESSAVLTWEDRRADGAVQIAAFWRQAIAADVIQFYYDDFTGQGPDRVLVTGVVSKHHQGRPDQTAPFVALWARQPGGAWRIRTWTVKTFTVDKSE
jgi:hypothetical protein